MLPEELRPASYRGAFFFVTGAATSGGRKDVLKEFVSSDRQLVEDLGLLPRSFNLSGTLAARLDPTGNVITPYQEVRDTFLAALEAGGPGILVHPFYGRLENIVARSFSLNESTADLGDASIQISFAISDADGRPQPQENVLATLVSDNTKVADAVGQDIAGRFSVTAALTGNFGDAMSKVTELADAFSAAVSPLAIGTEALDTWSAELSDLSTNVASLVAAPSDLSDSIAGIFATANGLFATAGGTLDAFQSLFDYGDLDINFSLNTATKIERQRNRDVLNSDCQALALSYAYLAAAQVNFPTVADIDAASQELEDQFQEIEAAGTLDTTVAEPLRMQRIHILAFFEAQRVTKPQVISVRVAPTSARLLAFQYYGTSDQGVTLALLNGLDQSAVIEGDVEILSV